MHFKKVLLLGANGQLGLSFVDHYQNKQQSGEYSLGCLSLVSPLCTYSGLGGDNPLDLRDITRLKEVLDRESPDLIINAAAYTQVDLAEQLTQQDTLRLVNIEAVACMAEWAARHGAILCHFSTDYVFNTDTPYPLAEDAPHQALNAYGLSKSLGEQCILSSGCKGFIFRTSWLYSEYRSNFVKAILQRLLTQDSLAVVDNQWGVPTSTDFVVNYTLQLLYRLCHKGEITRAEVYHLVPSGMATWYQFATQIKANLMLIREQGLALNQDLQQDLGTAWYEAPLAQLQPISYEAYCQNQAKPLAKRPFASVLSNVKLADLMHISLPSWQEVLSDFMRH